jgi:hypothetical protein
MPTTEQKKLGFWQVAVAGKDALDIPRGYASASKKGTYDRFTGFVSEFIGRCLRFGANLNVPELEEDRKQISSAKELEGNWWKRAIKAGKRSTEPSPSDDLPCFGEYSKDGDQKSIISSFMPAYRAIKESYDKRSWFQWITNHSQYTAERDSLRALKGMMMALLEVDSEGLNEKYNAYCKSVKDSGLTSEEIAAKVRENKQAIKDKAANKNSKDAQIEEEEKFDLPEKFLEDSGKVLRNYNTRSNNEDTHKKDVENCEDFRKNLDALFKYDEDGEVQEPISEDEDELNKSKISTNRL